MNPKLTPDRLRRRAIIYVRQSSPTQLAHNHESRRRQYALVEQARDMGFATTEVIDEDLGRSGSGLVERPEFEHLVASVCSGEMGAVFCIEASRLARNGRDAGRESTDGARELRLSTLISSSCGLPFCALGRLRPSSELPSCRTRRRR